MSESITRNVVVTDPAGVHIRSALAIVQTVQRGKSKVTIAKGEQRVEATDIWQIMGLVAQPGERLTVTATGPDAAAVLNALEPLFAGRFGDEAKKPE
ncbi:MAG: HPr family phosphocarrier protein [Thermoguttaceae bacterium]